MKNKKGIKILSSIIVIVILMSMVITVNAMSSSYIEYDSTNPSHYLGAVGDYEEAGYYLTDYKNLPNNYNAWKWYYLTKSQSFDNFELFGSEYTTWYDFIIKDSNVVIDYFNSSHNNMWYLNITNIKTSPKVNLIYQGTDVLGNYHSKKVIPLNNGNAYKTGIFTLALNYDGIKEDNETGKYLIPLVLVYWDNVMQTNRYDFSISRYVFLSVDSLKNEIGIRSSYGGVYVNYSDNQYADTYDWFAGQNVNTYVFDYTKTIDFRNFMIFDENNLLDNNAIISKGNFTITNTGSPMYLYDKYNKSLVHLMYSDKECHYFGFQRFSILNLANNVNESVIKYYTYKILDNGQKIIYEKYLQFFEDKSYSSMGLIGFDTLNELEHYYLLEGIYPAILKTSKNYGLHNGDLSYYYCIAVEKSIDNLVYVQTLLSDYDLIYYDENLDYEYIEENPISEIEKDIDIERDELIYKDYSFSLYGVYTENGINKYYKKQIPFDVIYYDRVENNTLNRYKVHYYNENQKNVNIDDVKILSRIIYEYRDKRSINNINSDLLLSIEMGSIALYPVAVNIQGYNAVGDMIYIERFELASNGLPGTYEQQDNANSVNKLMLKILDLDNGNKMYTFMINTYMPLNTIELLFEHNTNEESTIITDIVNELYIYQPNNKHINQGEQWYINDEFNHSHFDTDILRDINYNGLGFLLNVIYAITGMFGALLTFVLAIVLVKKVV